jgi:DNA repair protein RadB
VSQFVPLSGNRISTGSAVFDLMFGGGLPLGSVTDVFGAAGTGKTQFAFQSALMNCLKTADSSSGEKMPRSYPRVAFVDCAGSFRPERLAEICRARGWERKETILLDSIYSIKAGTVAAQKMASERFAEERRFARCSLLIVDDLTSNFASESEIDEEGLIKRQFELSLYSRQLAYLAHSRGIAVLVTNSARSLAEDGGEKETTGDILSAHCLFRVHFMKGGGQRRSAVVTQPFISRGRVEFAVTVSGIP